MKKLLKVLWILGLLPMAAAAEPLQWQVPYFGTLNLNVSTSEALLGYDAVNKQAVGGVSLPVYTTPMDIVTLQIGAVAPWPVGNQPTVQPLIAAGHDILKEIHGLNQYKTCHLNVFGRYDSANGKAGAGVSFSYSFAQ